MRGVSIWGGARNVWEGFIGSVTRASCVGSSGKHFFGGYGEAIASVRSCTPSGGWAGGLEKSSEGRPRMSESLCGVSARGLGMFWSLRGRNGDVLSRSSLDMAGRIAERGQFLEGSFKGE